MSVVSSPTSSTPETVHGPDLGLSWPWRVGLSLTAVGALVLIAMDVFPPTTPWNPLRDTMSQAQWGAGKWVFRLAVAGVALGSAAALTATAFGHGCRLGWAVAVPAGIWLAGLAVVTATVPHVPGTPHRVAGSVHEAATVIAFAALPVALILLGRQLTRSSPRRGRLAQASVIAAYSVLGVMLGW
ncbi:DUF998 domain-containing protein [Amycolatopsis sp. Hca4]|uniref:DUF998 domain-containing protein n=1 Tax=Amycolatopsis sp. Hca4 TaxID=2742131 RepID=UPI0015912BFE|nr:DUF998 domain-containing protein [Amycolatopsis sp. Hca4]QKV80726.1 DUF998 domain-containing protein [Amycolatopsis sp. Hca4]